MLDIVHHIPPDTGLRFSAASTRASAAAGF
jgi:hypothetical protein